MRARVVQPAERTCGKCRRALPCDPEHFTVRRDASWSQNCRACTRAFLAGVSASARPPAPDDRTDR